MASTYSPNLRLELIGTGEQQGTWGVTTNTNLGTLLEEAIGGYVSVPVTDGADTTLTTANGAVDQSRNMTINLTGALTAARNVICPAIEKIYIVKNATSGGFAVTFKVSGQTGVTIPNGSVVFIYVDGTDARSVTGSIASQAASAVAITGGTVNVGDAQAPRSDLQMTATTTPTAVVVGSISGTTLTVTAITSGTLAVGNRLFVAGLDYNIYITAFGSGSGLTGTYTINQTETLASTTINAYPSAYNTLTFYEKDTAVDANQPIGGIEWFGSDSSTPGGGVKAYIAAINESTTPDAALLFGTSDNSANTLAVERMRIDSNGNVGIGTSSPEASRALTLNGASNYNGIAFQVAGTTHARLLQESGGALYIDSNVQGGVNGGTFLRTGGTVRMFIDDSGNVGIGTTALTSKAVISDSSGSAPNNTSGNNILRLQCTQTAAVGVGPSILFEGQTGNSTANYGFAGIQGAKGSATASDYSGYLAFFTQASGGAGALNERMRIDGSGNVGIGVTPSAWSGLTALQIEGASIASSTRELSTQGNAYYNSGWKYIDTAAASQYLQSAGVHYWYTAASGTAGSAITFTERMRIDSSGNVLVTSSGGLGYGTGSGGTVTQATSKSTTVTLNKANGNITTNNAALAAGATVEFSVTNSSVAVTDTVILSGIWGASDGYRIELKGVYAGGFAVRITNITAGSLSEAIGINFAVIKAVTS